MARETRKNTDSIFRLNILPDILLALGFDDITVAKRILAMPIHNRVFAIKRAIATNKRLAADVAASKVRNARVEFKPLVFLKSTKRVSRSSADHTLRLSSSSSDSKAIREFLAHDVITVLPTKNSKGFQPNKKVRALGGSGLNSAERSRQAHSNVIHASRLLR